MILIEEEQKKPKTQLKVDRGGSGKPPRPTAVGMADGGDDDDNFSGGRIVLCKIIGTDPRGFKVQVLGGGVEAILETNDHFQLGRSVHAKFSYWSSSGSMMLEPATRRETKMFLRRDDSMFESAPHAQYEAMIGNDPSYKYDHTVDPTVTSDRRLQISKTWKSPFGNIFANSVLRGAALATDASDSLHRKRTLDMFIAPIGSSEYVKHKVDSFIYLRERLRYFKEYKFTGYVIAENDTFFSRGGMVFYRGNCVGAVYSNNFEQNTDDTASAMRSLLMELYSPPASFIEYSMPEEILLPYSALLVGKKLEVAPELTWKDILNKFKEEQHTGLLAIVCSRTSETLFVLVYDGKPSGFYMVQKRHFSSDTIVELDQILRKIDISSIYAAVLPEDDLNQTQFNPMEYLPQEL